MRNIAALSLSGVLFLSLMLFFMCGDLPTDPSYDPDNVEASFYIENIGSGVVEDDAVIIGLIVPLPSLTKSITISFGRSIQDTVVYANSSTSLDTIRFTKVFTDTGETTINATIELTNGFYKLVSHTFIVVPKQLTLEQKPALLLLPKNRVFTQSPQLLKAAQQRLLHPSH